MDFSKSMRLSPKRNGWTAAFLRFNEMQDSQRLATVFFQTLYGWKCRISGREKSRHSLGATPFAEVSKSVAKRGYSSSS
jgi:hypothetical protein